MWDRIPGKNSMSGTIHFVMARCCAKQVNQQLIAHISHSGPVKAALKNVKSIWRRPKVSDASVLTLNTTAVSAHCPAASQHVANSSRTVKNNGHTPVPFPPASHLFSCKPDEMVVLAKNKTKNPTQTESPGRVSSSFLLSVFWKRHHFIMIANSELLGVRTCCWDISPHGGQTNCVYSTVSAGISGAIKWRWVAVGGHIPCSLIKIASSCPLAQLCSAITSYHKHPHSTHAVALGPLTFTKV